MLTTEEITNRVTYHAPSSDGVAKHAALSGKFIEIMHDIDALVPDGREKAIVMTKLEEAKMWASAGVARNPKTR